MMNNLDLLGYDIHLLKLMISIIYKNMFLLTMINIIFKNDIHIYIYSLYYILFYSNYMNTNL